MAVGATRWSPWSHHNKRLLYIVLGDQQPILQRIADYMYVKEAASSPESLLIVNQMD
jgi:hypothetical protein